MQDLPDDTICLTPEEAKAIVDYFTAAQYFSDGITYPDGEPVLDALNTIKEQLEYEEKDEE